MCRKQAYILSNFPYKIKLLLIYLAILSRYSMGTLRKITIVNIYGSSIEVNFLFFFNGSYSPSRAPALFFSSVIIFYTEGRTPWTSDKPVARPLPIHRTIQTNKRIHRHPRLEGDSNPRSQCSSERRQFMP
jgi:hypothetical protein